MSWAPITKTNNTPEITMEWVKANKDTGHFQLVDCREQFEWDAGYISGALFVPLSDWNNQVSKVDPTKPVVVYCRSGVRSLKGANLLLSIGIEAASMKGGYLAFSS